MPAELFPKITERGLEDLRKRIGVKITDTLEPWCHEASRDGIRHYAHGIGDDNPLWSDPVAQAVQKVLDDEINPAVASHGGHVSLLEVKNEVAYIQLGGGCQGCGMVDVTLKQGIEVRIREAVPSIREIVDTTDHAGGKNPYYQPSKGGGRSPYA